MCVWWGGVLPHAVFFQEYIPIGNKKINAGKKARNKCEVTLGFRSTFLLLPGRNEKLIVPMLGIPVEMS